MLPKTISFTLILCLIALTQTAIISTPQLVGAYRLKSDEEVAQLQKDDKEFSKLITLTKAFWKANTNEVLGDLISVEEQIVAGSNYRLIFETVGDASSKQVVIIVFVQPWTKTMKVSYTSPQILGGIKNDDLTQL